jgi:hypothetical protein
MRNYPFFSKEKKYFKNHGLKIPVWPHNFQYGFLLIISLNDVCTKICPLQKKLHILTCEFFSRLFEFINKVYTLFIIVVLGVHCDIYKSSTIYHSWIHPLHHSPLSFLPPLKIVFFKLLASGKANHLVFILVFWIMNIS